MKQKGNLTEKVNGVVGVLFRELFMPLIIVGGCLVLILIAAALLAHFVGGPMDNKPSDEKKSPKMYSKDMSVKYRIIEIEGRKFVLVDNVGIAGPID